MPDIITPSPIINQTVQPPPPQGWHAKLNQVKTFVSANRWYVIAIAVGLVVIGALAFFAFRPQSAIPQAAKVDLAIDAPSTAPTGSEVVYKIKAENRDSATLVGLSLELVYPSGVTYISSQPNAGNLSGSQFNVPNLEPGQNAVIIVKVLASGDVNDEKRLLARLHYHYSSFNSEFVKEASATVRLVASDVNIQMEGPTTISSAQSVSYKVSYQNNSDKDINNARVQLAYPEGFSFASAERQPDVSNNIWNIGTLGQGQSGVITINGNFRSAQPGQSQTFTADFMALDSQGTFFVQASSKFTTAIAIQPLVITQEITNGVDNGIVKPGSTIQYKLRYRNNAAVVATGVNIVASIDSKAADLSSIRAEGANVSGSSITWNASSVSGLERLNPGEEGQVEFSVGVRNPAVRDTSTNITVKTSVKIKANEYSDFLTGNEITIKVASPGSVQTSLAHVSGELPPRVGKSSTYQITLSLRNATNDYNNAALTAFIPLGPGSFDAKSVSSKEVGKVNFDSSTGKLTWQVGTLSAHSGDFNPLRRLQFTVKFTPSQSQIGQEVVLLKNISFTAQDAFTGEAIQLSADQVTSEDLPNNRGEGRVEP